MSFWSNVGHGLIKSVTGGLYNPGGDKGPKLPKEQKTSKQVVGKSKQAGGAQIRYNTEEVLPVPAKPKTPKPQSDGQRAAAARRLQQQQGMAK